jgi:hypothetical protein
MSNSAIGGESTFVLSFKPLSEFLGFKMASSGLCGWNVNAEVNNSMESRSARGQKPVSSVKDIVGSSHTPHNIVR